MTRVSTSAEGLASAVKVIRVFLNASTARFFLRLPRPTRVCSVRLFWEEQPPFAFHAVRRGRHFFVPAAKSGRWMKIRGFLAPVAAAKSVSLTQQGNEGLMGLAITETGPQPNGTRPRRANRRLNG